tara:strand:+ start:36 stop:569 length:534 start_codon:yes stop_codon:yes gene_type:complete
MSQLLTLLFLLGNTITVGAKPIESNASIGWAAKSHIIRYAEGTLGQDGYYMMFTGKLHYDLSKHPALLQSSRRYTSDAAGAYQFLSTTWKEVKYALALPDFSPDSQEKAARYLVKRRGVDPDAIYTTKYEFTKAIDKLAPEWAALPYSGTYHGYYGQTNHNIDTLYYEYQKQLKNQI